MKALNRYEWNEDRTELVASDKGLIFQHPRYGKVADLYQEDFQIVGTYVDTFRQLFRGAMNQDLLTDIEDSISLNLQTQFQLLGQDWLIGKSAKCSGYQYRLQNNHLGLILLFKQYHAKSGKPCFAPENRVLSLVPG